jgi:hypothetical protein
MRRPARRATISPVSHPERGSVRIVVELDPRASAPSGRVTDERGAVARFSGWLELMDRVESALGSARAADPETGAAERA